MNATLWDRYDVADRAYVKAQEAYYATSILSDEYQRVMRHYLVCKINRDQAREDAVRRGN